jgi:hypothetical protein
MLFTEGERAGTCERYGVGQQGQSSPNHWASRSGRSPAMFFPTEKMGRPTMNGTMGCITVASAVITLNSIK